MSHLRLEALREKLLCAGVAPRHVRRYMRELDQHLHELVQAELAGGLATKEARQAARVRLGSEDELAAAMLAQPSLRSVSARYPWAVFGISPLLLLAIMVVAAVYLEIGVIKLNEWITGEAALGPAAPWLKSLLVGWNTAVMYALPFLMAAFFCAVGVRQRLALGWIALGATLSVVLGVLYSMGVVFSSQKGMSELSLGVGFSTDMGPRLLLNLTLAGLMTAGCWLWRRQITNSIP